MLIATDGSSKQSPETLEVCSLLYWSNKRDGDDENDDDDDKAVLEEDKLR